MNKIKDFFYNKNDIIIVLVILVIAGFLIYDRVSLFMDYPQQAADKARTQTEQAE